MVIILYVMDSLRPDFLSCYGHRRETSPNIDSLAQDGVVFLNAFAQSTWTRASAASILTSLYPSVHGVLTLQDHFNSELDTLQGHLHSRGFETLAFTTMKNISPYFGYHQGFEEFVEVYENQEVRKKRTLRIEVTNIPISTSEDINQCLLPFLERKADNNVFLFVWSLDTHDPYFHRDPGLAMFSEPSEEILWADRVVNMHGEGEILRLQGLYEDMIRHNDHHIGVLIDKLKSLGLFEETLFIITGDHGESFGEHGVNSHGGTPYDEVIHIPLIIKFPAGMYRARISELVQHIDIGPTILDFVDGSGGETVGQGKSLMPLLQNGRGVNDCIFVETQLRSKLPRCSALRTVDHKYISMKQGSFTMREWLKEREQIWPPAWWVRKPRMLFSLRDDPGEMTNIVRKDRIRANYFEDRLEELLATCQRIAKVSNVGEPKKGGVSPDVARQLKALGYFE